MKWILIKEKLPPVGEYVLVHYAKFITDKEEDWRWSDNSWRTSILLLGDDGLWYDETRMEDFIPPTHWMPLPNPPQP